MKNIIKVLQFDSKQMYSRYWISFCSNSVKKNVLHIQDDPGKSLEHTKVPSQTKSKKHTSYYPETLYRQTMVFFYWKILQTKTIQFRATVGLTCEICKNQLFSIFLMLRPHISSVKHQKCVSSRSTTSQDEHQLKVYGRKPEPSLSTLKHLLRGLWKYTPRKEKELEPEGIK